MLLRYFLYENHSLFFLWFEVNMRIAHRSFSNIHKLLNICDNPVYLLQYSKKIRRLFGGIYEWFSVGVVTSAHTLCSCIFHKMFICKGEIYALWCRRELIKFKCKCRVVSYGVCLKFIAFDPPRYELKI